MYKFSVPSKTFILGEYAVMQGGVGLLVGTKPRFEAHLKINRSDQEATYEGFSQQGPAMNFLKDHLENFSNYSVSIQDPHNGKGGLGWSSAQFILLYAIQKWIVNKQEVPEIDKEDLLETFLKYAWNGEGWAPSGLDILCHLVGGFMQVTAPKKFESKKIKSIMVENFQHYSEWPFKELDFAIIRTGEKVATHAHLSKLQQIDFKILSDISAKAGASLKLKDEETFLTCINQYRETLEGQKLVAPNSLKLFKLLQDRPEVLAFKGCGALGADVILAVVVKDLMSDFKEWTYEEDFEWIASSMEMSQGLLISSLNSKEEK